MTGSIASWTGGGVWPRVRIVNVRHSITTHFMSAPIQTPSHRKQNRWEENRPQIPSHPSPRTNPRQTSSIRSAWSSLFLVLYRNLKVTVRRHQLNPLLLILNVLCETLAFGFALLLSIAGLLQISQAPK